MARITIIPEGTITFSCGSQHVIRVLVPKGRSPQIPDADEETSGEGGDNGEGDRGGSRGSGGPRGGDASPTGSSDDDDSGSSSDQPIFVPPPILPFLAKKPPQELMHLSVLRVRSVEDLDGMLAAFARAWGDHPAQPRDLIVYLAERSIDIPTLTSICNQLPEDTNVTVVLTAGDA